MSADKSKVACPVCDTVGQWENVDKYKNKKEGMHLCTNCGMVFYPEKYMSDDEAKAYYENDYRKPPNWGNLTTGNRKLQMHSHFLTDTLKSWMDKGLKDPVVSDIGAAYGLFLNWIKTHFPEADLNGTEFAKAYRRNSYHEFGIELSKDFDMTKKYDLISSFKVAEHQLDVKKRLREYVECLKPDGLMYISVPTWFGKMTNFGLEGFDLDYYYHPDHINVWTRRLFETVLKMVGLEVVKFDEVMYDETYLCKRNDELMKETPVYENPDDVRKALENIQKADQAYKERRFDDAIKYFPNFFEAHQARYEVSRKSAHEGQEKPPLKYIEETYLKPCFDACGDSLNALRFATDIYMRYDDFPEAIRYIEKSLEYRPNNGSFLMALSHCYRQLALREKDAKKKLDLMIEARDVCKYLREVDISAKTEATNWIYQSNSEIPTPGELQQ
jgi:SAM-dependent methyltransferase